MLGKPLHQKVPDRLFERVKQYFSRKGKVRYRDLADLLYFAKASRICAIASSLSHS